MISLRRLVIPTLLLPATLAAGTAAAAGGAPGSYKLDVDCTNWCGEASLAIAETVVRTATGEVAGSRQLHPREYEAVTERGASARTFPAGEPGTYQVVTTAAGQANQIMLFELILDTSRGDVVARRWLSPRVYDLLDALPGAELAQPAPTHQRAIALFGPGQRCQDFFTVLDVTSGVVVSRYRVDSKSPTRRDEACLPSMQWIEAAPTPGSYQVSSTARGADEKKALVYETVMDTRDGRVVSRRAVHQRAFQIQR